MPTSGRDRRSRLPGKRQTRQRQTIFDVIRRAPGPLTVPEIHERAREVVPTIGTATVYRTIKLLHHEKHVEPVTLPGGETRYELAGMGHHHHFQCRGCDEVYDLDECPVRIPEGEILGGFRIEAHELTLYGLCPECSG